MNKLILIFFVISAFGSDQDKLFPTVDFSRPHPSNSLHRLNFMPREGSFSLLFKAFGHTETVDWKEDSDLNRSTEGSGGLVNFTYGYSSRFSLFFETDYLSVDKATYRESSSKYQNKSRGVSDPILGFKWRLLYQKRSPFSLDLEYFYSPNSGKAKAAGDGGNGNRLRGGKKTGAALYLTRQFDFFEYQFFAKLAQQGEYNQTYSHGTEVSFNSFTQREVGFSTMYMTSNNAFGVIGVSRCEFGNDAYRMNGNYLLAISSYSRAWVKLGSIVDKGKIVLSLNADYRKGDAFIYNSSLFNATYRDLIISFDVLLGNF